MDRRAEFLEGLAVAGPARFGPFTFRTPELLWAAPSDRAAEIEPSALRLSAIPAVPLGERAVAWTGSSGSLALRFRVPAPEATGSPGEAAEVAPAQWVVWWPLNERALARVARSAPELVVLANARALYASGRSFVAAMGALRRTLGARPVLWLPRVALPHRLALLTYLGADVLDTTEGVWRASEGVHFDPVFGEVSEGVEAGAQDEATTSEGMRRRYAEELARVRYALAHARLRELVEARESTETTLTELLRYADRDLADLLEERAPVVGSESRPYIFSASFRRPEVDRFRRRLLERYRPPASKRVLLLVPCSRTKPYRRSRSHRRFALASADLAGREAIHTVSVSSPLGLVPQELELVYPARNYDVPVTGDWSAEERTVVARALGHLWASGQYRSLVLHLDPAEYDFLRAAIPPDADSVWTLRDDRTTTTEAVASLRAALERTLAKAGPTRGGTLASVRDELEALARFQFGPEVAERIFQGPVRLAGRPWAERIVDANHRDLATWNESRGLFQLTMAGAERLRGVEPGTVRIRPGLELKGDLFTPGVERASPGIRVGDAVLLTQREELVAVGEARLPGPLMGQLPHGTAVAVRHHRHPLVRPEPAPTVP